MPSVIEPMLAAVVAEFEDPLGSACLALSNDDHVQSLNANSGAWIKKKQSMCCLFLMVAPRHDLILAYKPALMRSTMIRRYGSVYLHSILHGLLHLLGRDRYNKKK